MNALPPLLGRVQVCLLKTDETGHRAEDAFEANPSKN